MALKWKIKLKQKTLHRAIAVWFLLHFKILAVCLFKKNSTRVACSKLCKLLKNTFLLFILFFRLYLTQKCVSHYFVDFILYKKNCTVNCYICYLGFFICIICNWSCRFTWFTCKFIYWIWNGCSLFVNCTHKIVFCLLFYWILILI